MGIEILGATVPDAQEHITRRILSALPDRFGISEAIEQYARESRDLETYVAFDGGAPVGFLSLKETSDSCTGMHVLGVRAEYQRMGIGRRFCAAAAESARARGKRLVSVMTRSNAHPDPFSAKTRAFCRAMEFLPVMGKPL